MVFYHRTLSSFPSFQNHIEQFLCHWKCKIKSYKCFLHLKSKGTKPKTQEEKEWYYVSIFVYRPSLLLATISWSFLIHFEQFQRLQMRYLKIYKTCLKWKVLKKKVKSLSFKIILNTYEKIQNISPCEVTFRPSTPGSTRWLCQSTFATNERKNASIILNVRLRL
jgi:hypothetical protein